MNPRKHILHIVYKFSTGGLENGLVNLINNLSEDAYTHTVLSLTDQDDFSARITHAHINIICLNKKPGPLAKYAKSIIKIIKSVNPDILHTRNLSTIECQWMGKFSGVPFRIHSEHGRDMHDIDGLNRKSIWLRQWMKPFIHHYIALSKDLETYLIDTIKVKPNKISQIYNGVDTTKFYPAKEERQTPLVLLAAGRLDPVKNLTTLIEGFALSKLHLEQAELWIVGDGVEASLLRQQANHLGVENCVKFLGVRDDLPLIYKRADLYVQTSLFEGISNTLLEAMASGVCPISTKVGGTPEIINHQNNGWLLAPQDPKALSEAILALYFNKQERKILSKNARQTVCDFFSLENMLEHYNQIYTTNRELVCVA